ncbi:MAG: MATE family efflux transporter [Pseudomonadales bacterium]|nr:MATE family efflux transporter [Pseudomonadales bacterium]MBO6595202.1 MATE family efflux transporter [Pseudomonadales bacterium]MBO6656235.1 MATE family efflux transporter [Pseudomonadales bacterium]MBO6821239.1 MATE family efflux transporter [Pseudomonadales bacterium]
MSDEQAETPRLVQGRVSQGLLRLAAPVILGITANIGAGLIEAFFLAQVSTVALAAYSFTFAVQGALMSLSLGISIGVSSVLARTVGSGDMDQVRRIASDGLLLVAMVMIVMSMIGYITIDPLFRALGADDTTLPLITGYMTIYYLSVVFMAVPSVGANALRATGDASISGTIMVSGAVLQICISPFLIFGWMGLPALGLVGAAWSTLISRLILFIITMAVLHYREHLITYAGVTLSLIMNSWRRIMAVSIPATATNLIGPISTAIIVSLLADFSQETVAGFGIASRIEGLFVIPLFALSASIGPFVGQNWGADRYDRANRAMLLSFQYSLGWGVLVAILLMTFRQPIAGLFDDNPEVIEVAAHYLLLVPISYGTWGVLMMASAIFNSLGKPVSSTIMSIIRMFALYIPLAFLGKWMFGMTGIFLAAAVSNLAMGAIAYKWNRNTYGRSGLRPSGT